MLRVRARPPRAPPPDLEVSVPRPLLPSIVLLVALAPASAEGSRAAGGPAEGPPGLARADRALVESRAAGAYAPQSRHRPPESNLARANSQRNLRRRGRGRYRARWAVHGAPVVGRGAASNGE